MRSLTATAVLAAALLTASLTLGYAQSRGDGSNATTTEPGEAMIDTSTSTGSIVSDTSSGQPDKSVHDVQGTSDAAPDLGGMPKSPCPSGLGTGNGDCR